MNDDLPWWRAFATPQFAISTLFIAMTTYVIVKVLEGDYGNEVKLVIITVVVSNGLPDLRKYWLNSTSESEKKSETINTLAKGTGTGSGNGQGGAVSVQIEAREPAKDAAETVERKA